jgi:hypothetical protein
MGVQTDDLLAQVGELRHSIAADRRAVNDKWSQAEALVNQIVDSRGKRERPRTNRARQLSTAMAFLVLPIVVLGSLIGWTYGGIIFTALAFLIIQVGVNVLAPSTEDEPSRDWVL